MCKRQGGGDICVSRGRACHRRYKRVIKRFRATFARCVFYTATLFSRLAVGRWHGVPDGIKAAGRSGYISVEVAPVVSASAG